MVDLHCHILPGVDDGAPDLEAALALARAAVDNGIRAAVLTPHVFPGRWDNSAASLTPVFEAFQAEVRRCGIPLDLHLGCEVHLLADSLRMFEQGQLPLPARWNERQVLLLEMPDGGIPVGALQAVDFLLRRGAVPMIAHPERNKAVMRSLDKLWPFVEAGCLVQLTAASVCGRFGAPAQATAQAILEAGWATVVATDAHNLRHRPPLLAEARQALAMRYGEEPARRLTETHPMRMLPAAGGAIASGTD